MNLTKLQKEEVEKSVTKKICKNLTYLKLDDWRRILDIPPNISYYHLKKSMAANGIREVKSDLKRSSQSLYCINDWEQEYTEILRRNCKKNARYISDRDNCVAITDSEVDVFNNVWMSPKMLCSIFNKEQSWSAVTAKRHSFKKNTKGWYLYTDFLRHMKNYGG